MLGIVPAAGAGSRIQPLAFSKELLPVGSRRDGDTERPRAVSEYVIERMLAAGADRICFVISAGKSDILEYYGGSIGGAQACYVVQPKPAGLCDAIFRALPWVQPDETVLIGLPDTIWFPIDALNALPDDSLALLLFPVSRPEFFDAVITDARDRVREIQVKRPDAQTSWIWGAFKLKGRHLQQLAELWHARGRCDEYMGTLINAYLDRGGEALAVRAGEAYVDVGTVHGYREAMALLSAPQSVEAFAPLGAGAHTEALR
jgi:dTDP-glucose pyrophosphorylase